MAEVTEADKSTTEALIKAKQELEEARKKAAQAQVAAQQSAAVEKVTAQMAYVEAQKKVNQAVIGENPIRVRSGMVLKIPELPQDFKG